MRTDEKSFSVFNLWTGRPPRSLSLPAALAALIVISFWFYYRQNFAGQIGGEMSVAKLLWLDYAITSWLVLPFFLWRSSLLAPALRTIYGAHLVIFGARAGIELWMLYVTISWIPLYGIAEDFFSILLITGLLWWKREELRRVNDGTNLAAVRFLTSIRLGLICEIVFAWLFYRATGGVIGIYFAGTDPVFDWINGLTWAAIIFLYPDLLYVIWTGRDALLPIVEPQHA